MTDRYTFWVDLETTPDVLFYEPVIKELWRLGHEVLITGRRGSGVPELAASYGMDIAVQGIHPGAGMMKKRLAAGSRIAQLIGWRLRHRKPIDLSMGFSARAMHIASRIMRIRTVSVFDYEHGSFGGVSACARLIGPVEVTDEYLASRGADVSKVVRYPGIKEETYTGLYEPTEDLRAKFGVADDEILVVLRPPATSAHYHGGDSVEICTRVLERIVATDKARCLVLPRHGEPHFDHFFAHPGIEPLTETVKGLDLVTAADVVISGGGTMVREAVTLGVPAYSIFTGEQGAVDARLSAEGRLTLVRELAAAEDIVIAQRPNRDEVEHNPEMRDFLVETFLAEAAIARHGERVGASA